MAPKPDGLYRDPALAEFYDLDNGWGEDLDYCLALARGAGSALDLGCGTGRLAAAIARKTGAEVVGADPAAAMLDLARARPGGGVHWVEADARGLDLGRRFDLVVLTGHAFHVFLTPADRAAALAAIARHLAPAGRFVFDSRAPERAEWREWTPDLSLRALPHPRRGAVAAWNEAWEEPGGIVAYATHYRIEATGEVLSGWSRIAFPPRAELAAALAAAGLAVDRWLGDWRGTPWTAAAPEIIPIGRLA
jgi:SAM-dependent methyltransferase